MSSGPSIHPIPTSRPSTRSLRSISPPPIRTASPASSSSSLSQNQQLRQSPRRNSIRRRRGSSASTSSASKENIPITPTSPKNNLTNPISSQKGMSLKSSKIPNGTGSGSGSGSGIIENGDHGSSNTSPSILEDGIPSSELRKRGVGQNNSRLTKSPSPIASSSKSPLPSPSPSDSSTSSSLFNSHYNGLPTLPPIEDDSDYAILSESPNETPRGSISKSSSGLSGFKPPPPASSTGTASGQKIINRPRRTSSIHRKPSPGVRPVKAVDWEIPRKTLHSSIGFLVLFLYYLNPPTLTPLLTFLSVGLASVTIADYVRFNFPQFREYWELYFGFLMRESERDKINGVVWYLVGVIFVLALYPRDVAVVAILTLSWSDTTASTIGRLWGRHTPPLPPHFPYIPAIKFAPRKSLAGFLAATFTGMLICIGFWWGGSGTQKHWAVLDSGVWGLLATAGFVGTGGAVVEALDMGLDDNLTLPILSGAITWIWLGFTNHLLSPKSTSP